MTYNRQFIYKCRVQLLGYNSLLHRYYPHVYPKSCLLCRNPYDTVSHVLNGCINFEDMYYSRRHDRIVNHIPNQTQISLFSITELSMLPCSIANLKDFMVIWFIANRTWLSSIRVKWKLLSLKFLLHLTHSSTNVIRQSLTITCHGVTSSMWTLYTRAKLSLLLLALHGVFTIRWLLS